MSTDFTVSLDQLFKEKVTDNVIAIQKKVALEALKRVVLKSPVGNPDLWSKPAPPGYVGGRFRGNWQLSVGVRNDGTLETIDPSGSATIANGLTPLSELSGLDIVYIQNNLEYAEAIENGHSKQAPAGVVAITVAEIEAFFSQVIK